MISRELLSIYRVSQAHSNIPRNREAWNTDLEECDASGADLSRDIG